MRRRPLYAVLTIAALAATGCDSEPRHHHRDRPPYDDTDPPRAERQHPVDYPPGGYGGGDVSPVGQVAVRGGHPKLFLTNGPADFAAVDPQAQAWQQILVQHANDQLAKPLLQYSAKDMLARSREGLTRLTTLAGAYRVNHDPRFADGARREMLNVCSWPSWEPEKEFLATSEMMVGVATAYDWLFDALPPQDRQTIAEGLTRNGLQAALTAYQTHSGWTVARHNWSEVCNGGVIVCSLALMDEQPQLARRTLDLALHSIANGLGGFDPQGGTPEGPMYHTYAMRFLTYAAAAMESATGSDQALEGISRNWTHAGDYRVQTCGPVEDKEGDGLLSANFGDGNEVVGNSAWMLWFARHFNQPQYAAFEIQQDAKAPSAFDLLWYTQPGRPVAPPLGEAFGSVITMRTAFDDPNATFLALRIGSNADNHTHLDLGSFDMDMIGSRWATDLGSDNYDMPGYLNKRRAEYLRSSTPGHNTLSIGDASQPLDATATGTLQQQPGRGYTASIDLTRAYPGARVANRQATLNPDGSVTIADQVRLDFPGPVVWNLHTTARVTPGPNGGATLEQNGRRVEMRVIEPSGARLSFEPDVTRPPAKPVENVTHVRLEGPPGRQARFVVQFVPMR